MAKFKPQHRRFAFIDRKIREGMKRGVYANCSSLAREWETSTKTIQRDIEHLRDQMDIPLAYDANRRGYFYTEKNYKLPAIPMSESDLFAVCIAEKALKQYENTPLHGRLERVFRKIEESLPQKTTTVRPAWVDTRFSFFHEPPRRLDPKIWEIVAEAVRECNTLTFDYHAPGRELEPARQVDPYHLVHFRGDWYILGKCHKAGELRTFALSRIRKATPGKGFDLPADFNAEKVLGTHFGIMWGKEEFTVKVRFTADQAPYVAERDWHPSQKIEENPDGSILFTVKVNHLAEIKFWILSWGKAAKVIEPKELADEIRKEVDAMNDTYH
ncbi:MAG: WYL domain-containing protein [Planctomycetota bacterium]